MLGKNTILKAIHNNSRDRKKIANLRMLGKNTILKAIHNFNLAFWCRILPANAR